VLVPVNPRPVEGPQAEEMRKWGVDPALGRSLIDGLSDAFRVVAFDYEGHVLQVPKPDTLPPATMAGDLLAVVDGAGAYTPLDGPYAQRLQVTVATHEIAIATAASAPGTATPSQPPREPSEEPDWSTAEMSLTEPQTRQFVTLYKALSGFEH